LIKKVPHPLLSGSQLVFLHLFPYGLVPLLYVSRWTNPWTKANSKQ
jgi:hypothetical protein